MIFKLLCLMTIFVRTWTFMLDGSVSSYAQFSKWNIAMNGTLEFEFKTKQGSGLLLYTDDGGMYDFFEIKLVESAVRLRYNLGGGAQIVTVGHDLSDGHWHKVQVIRSNENTTLVVDTLSAVSVSRGKEFKFGKYSSNSDVYIGGMPSWYNSKLTLLALPSVIFEPKFHGQIRNVIYANDNFTPKRQEMISRHLRSIHNSVSINSTDICEIQDPCQHDGICISTDSGPICECRSGNYEGEYCEKDKIPTEAAFKGTEYLEINLNKNQPVIGSDETISLHFKTRQHNGLLFYSGDGDDYLIISLKDGGVAVNMILKNGRLDLHIKPSKVRFDDNQWHKIFVQRRVQELSAAVDGIYAEHAHTAGSFTRLSTSHLLIGGGSDTKFLQKNKGITNFVGCVRKVTFKAEGYSVEIIESVKTGTIDSKIWGKVDFYCREPKSDPITFTTGDSHIILPPLKPAKSESISFKIRTTEPNGLIMYSQSGTTSRSDLLGFEMLDGYLHLHINLGSGHTKIQAYHHRLDNGTWHDIALRRVDRNGRITVDGETIDFFTIGDSTQLDIDGLLYIGGIGMPFASLSVPSVLWTATLKQGYIGCMRDLVINGQPIDIAGYAQQQDFGAVRPACHVQSHYCSSQPCMNGGNCIEGWNRFSCDCTSTSFIGPTCGKAASTLHLNGSQQMIILMPEDSKTQVEEISIRFKTTKPLGLLVSTSSESSHNKLEIYLEKGIAKFRIQIGEVEQTLFTSQGLNDDTWHTLRVSRRAFAVKLQVDNERVIRAEKQLDNDGVLEFRTIHVGGYHYANGNIPNFVGQIQQFWFNGHPYLEIARNAGSYQHSSHHNLIPIIKVTGFFEKRYHPVHHAVTFTSKHTFVGLPVLKAYIETSIYFQFKTWESSGLILFNAGREKDFIAIELIDGHIHYIFDLGDGPIKMKDSSKARLNDGKWHAVIIGRPSPKRHILTVDDHAAVTISQGTNENLDLDGILYIGGVEKSQYEHLPNYILSNHGFEGCLASLDLSGESIDIISDAVISSALVETGCDSYVSLHSTKKCAHNKCFNYGKCIQQWNGYTCDCDMTTYIGPRCKDEAVAYEFGPGRGLITYTFPSSKRPKMERDSIAMGFITSISDAVLLRIDSATNDHYLEIGIIEGNVFVIYNIGSNDHPIGETGIKVNDNQYHVIRFIRNGLNSTLQVDNYNVQTSYTSGHHSTVFNSQSTIQIGGKWNKTHAKVEKPFLGVISGLVVNGARILELASDTEDRIVITIRGDVQPLTPGSLLEKTAPLQRMQQTPASGLPGVMDDLIFSGAGSGCAGDDEDNDCTPIDDPKSDDLITPVYTRATKQSITIKSKAKDMHERITCDDEEECSEGSGDMVTTEQILSPTNLIIVPSYTMEMEVSTNEAITTASIDSTFIAKSTTAPTSTINITTEDVTTETSVAVTTVDNVTTQVTTQRNEVVVDEIDKEIGEILPPIMLPPKTKDIPKIPSIHSDAAKNAALIIAIIAGALIAIVLIILLILKFKNRPETSYKVEETKNFCHDPNVALLGTINSCQTYNGSLKQVTNIQKNTKKRETKDIKEWYV